MGQLLPKHASISSFYSHYSGYGQAAVKLQQFWLRDPQALPFAQHVDRRALISLVSKGLKYSQIERLHSKVRFLHWRNTWCSPK